LFPAKDRKPLLVKKKETGTTTTNKGSRRVLRGKSAPKPLNVVCSRPRLTLEMVTKPPKSKKRGGLQEETAGSRVHGPNIQGFYLQKVTQTREKSLLVVRGTKTRRKQIVIPYASKKKPASPPRLGLVLG